MRIDAYNQISKLYHVQQSVNTSKMQENQFTIGKDEVSISGFAHDYQVAKKAMAEVPDVREDKIEKLKQQIQSGKYEVSPESFANKLLENYNHTAF